MSWYLAGIKKYATFSGRARRKEYWMFFLFNLIFMAVAAILDNLIGTTFKVQGISAGYGFIYVLYSLFMLLPYISIAVRRLHDQDKSGGWFFIFFIPCIGWIWFIVLMCLEGTPGSNRFGENPKA